MCVFDVCIVYNEKYMTLLCPCNPSRRKHTKNADKLRVFRKDNNFQYQIADMSASMLMYGNSKTTSLQ